MKERNLTLLTDLYQLTMAFSYWKANKHQEQATFDLFYRKHPESPFAIVSGIKEAIEYINDFHFYEEDLSYLRNLCLFDEDFLNYLSTLKFTGEILAMNEGDIVFPNEPIMRISGDIIQCQLLETTLLNIINHQTLIATKAHRVVYAANGSSVSEFGLRRAQGPDAGLYGSKAAYIAGCSSTSNVLAGKEFNIPVSGTHAHSWIMSFDTELKAFRKYAETFPNKCLLLVDTFNVLKSGVPNAIKVFDELKEKGYKPLGIRLDSGDLAYLSKKARKMLDDAGHKDALIFVTNDLDEYTIQSLKIQGAKIDVYGVGTKLITSYNTAALGGVYKLSELNGKPKMKLSENIEKTTNPGKKMVWRFYNKEDGMAVADIIGLDDENFDGDIKELKIYHPHQTWKSLVIENVRARKLLNKYIENGEQCKNVPTIEEARQNLKEQLKTFWEEYLRLMNPAEYKVDISDKLYDKKKTLVDLLS